MKGVFGIGNAIVDLIITLNTDDTLNSIGLEKGSMTLINKEKSDYIISNFKIKEISTGGSAANTIRALSKLNIPSAFYGKVGNDNFGNFFIDDTINSGTKSYIKTGSLPTGNAITFVTPDSERTFATYLGSASEVSTEDLDFSALNDFDIIYFEGYLLDNTYFTESIFNFAKKYNLKIALDLSSYNVVERNIEFLKKILPYVDILFANELEAYAYCKKDPENSAKSLGKLVPTAIVKAGKNGSYVFNNNNLFYIPSYEAKVIDTTGAGDLYAAGFLYGYLRNYSIEKAGKIGSYLASKVIENYGTKIKEEYWQDIFLFLEKI